jgi:hypothetical protein
MSRILIILLALTGTALAAPKKHVGYVGVHPLPGSVLCEIEGPHLHFDVPEHASTLYRVHQGRYHFIGDPTSFGYEGPTFAFHGHHPIVIVGHVHETYCNLEGPHHHLYKPPATTFVLRGDVYVYVGPKPRRHAPVAHIDVRVPSVVVDVHYDVRYKKHKRHKKHRRHHRHHHHHHDDDD